MRVAGCPVSVPLTPAGSVSRIGVSMTSVALGSPKATWCQRNQPQYWRFPMAVEVALFNTSSQTILFVVNNGPQCAVAGTGAPVGWQPQTQAPGTGPTYSPNYPQPNVVGQCGMNQIAAYIS